MKLDGRCKQEMVEELVCALKIIAHMSNTLIGIRQVNVRSALVDQIKLMAKKDRIQGFMFLLRVNLMAQVTALELSNKTANAIIRAQGEGPVNNKQHSKCWGYYRLQPPLENMNMNVINNTTRFNAGGVTAKACEWGREITDKAWVKT